VHLRVFISELDSSVYLIIALKSNHGQRVKFKNAKAGYVTSDKYGHIHGTSVKRRRNDTKIKVI
jgi:hypothetical protein